MAIKVTSKVKHTMPVKPTPKLEKVILELTGRQALLLRNALGHFNAYDTQKHMNQYVKATDSQNKEIPPSILGNVSVEEATEICHHLYFAVDAELKKAYNKGVR